MKLHRFLCLIFLASCVAMPKSAQFNSHDYQSYIDKGVVYLLEYDAGSLEGIEKAEALFEMAADLNSDLPAAYDGLGAVFVRRGNLFGAERLFQHAIELDNTYSRAYVHLAYIREKQGQTAEAEMLLRRAVLQSQNDYIAHNNLGALLYNAHLDIRASRMQFLKAEQLAPGNSTIIKNNLKLTQ